MVEVSRRGFLHLLGLSATALVAGCTDGGSAVTTRAETGATTGTAGQGTATSTSVPLSGDLPYSVWEQVRAAVRGAPDHLPARADEVVSTGDAEAIFRFVRDRISVLPAGNDGFARSVAARRWGVRGALRCGWGTPRERADLLAELYRRAGFEAEVVEGAFRGQVAVEDLIRPRTDLRFAPAVDQATISRWHDALGISEPTVAPDPDPGGELASALTDLVLSTLAESDTGTAFVPTLPDRVPLVRLILDGVERFANPLTPDATFGDPLVDSPVQALAGDSLPDVTVALSCARSVDPGERFTLAEGRWPLEEAIGRLVVARFVPAGDFSALFTTPLDSIPTFTALLGLDGVDMNQSELVERAFLGDSISVLGDRVRASATTTGVIVGEEAVGGDPDGASAVTTITASVSAQSFPVVYLAVGAADVVGEPVVDLPAAAFTLEEDERPLSFSLTASHAPTPSVLLLLDGSKSLPDEFLGDGVRTLARQLAEEILAIDPKARFRLGGINYGTASVSPSWLATGPEVEAEAARVIADGSELWSALADTRGVGASVVVLVTDGQATDTDEQVGAARQWVHGGPPVVVVGVGDFNAAVGEDIARTSGGVSITVADRAGAVRAVTDFLAAGDSVPYRMAYRAPEEGPTTRRIRVRVGTTESSIEYVVPSAAERLAPPALCGLYLTVGIGSANVTRTLAGVPWEDASSTTPVSSAVVDEVRSALVGAATLSVEAGPPTGSVWLDDFITAKLSQRPLYEARRSGLEDQLEALKSGIHVLPPELPALQGPALVNDPLTFPSGPHAVLLTARPLASGNGQRRVDVLPFCTWSTASDTGAFAATVGRTARMAVLEAALYADSTLARLRGRPLTTFPRSMPAPRDGITAPWARLLDAYAGFSRVVPTDDGPFAFWAIDPQGSMIGVLPDGSGGGSDIDDIGKQCSDVSRWAAAIQLSGAAMGLPFAGLVSLQKAISLQVLRAAAIIATLENPQVPKACDKGLGDLACDWAKDTLASVTWTGYGAIDTADDVSEAAGGGGLVDC